MPRNRTKNTPIGFAPCPFKDCDLTGEVFRFRQWNENEKLVRKAGRLYLVCVDHGMTQDQKYLDDHATISDQDKTDAARSPTAADPDAGDTQASPENDNDDDNNPWGFLT